MPYGFIYKIKFPNGKHYIGLTKSLEQRKKAHIGSAKNGGTNCLYNALRAYDMIDTFELIEIDTADTLVELCEKEIGYILEYNSHYLDGYGYNMTYGGDGTNGYVYTEKDRQKMREGWKKYHKEHPEAGKEHSERLKQYYKQPGALQKNSEAQKKYHEEHPEAKHHLREVMKKYHEDHPEVRQQIRERVKKYHEENPEARKTQSERMIKYHQDNPGETQQRIDKRKQNYKENPESRRKLSDKLGKNKPFDAFTADGTFIKTFNYQFEAIEYLKKKFNITSRINISAVLLGNAHKAAGFVFKYK